MARVNSASSRQQKRGRFRTARAQRQSLRCSFQEHPCKPPPYRSVHDPVKTGVQSSGPWDPWLPVVENSRLSTQRGHSARCAPEDCKSSAQQTLPVAHYQTLLQQRTAQNDCGTLFLGEEQERGVGRRKAGASAEIPFVPSQSRIQDGEERKTLDVRMSRAPKKKAEPTAKRRWLARHRRRLRGQPPAVDGQPTTVGQ